MRLISFKVNKMHGYIDVDIQFKDGLSIIIGGNGSGKTSALTLLANVLRVQTDEILKTKFEELELNYEIIERKRPIQYLLTINPVNSLFTISLHRGTELIAQQQLDIISNQIYGFNMSVLDLSSNIDNIRRKLGVHIPGRTSKKNIAEKVEIGAKVTFVRLDRAISAIDSHGGISFEEPDNKKELVAWSQRKGQLRDPLDVVRDVTMAKYVSYRNRLEDIKSKTYDELFRIHFADSDFAQDLSIRMDKLDKKLNELEDKLNASSSIIHFPEFQQYLKNTKLINTEVQSMKAERRSGRKTRLEEVLSAQLVSRAKKIELLLNVFDEESKESASAYLSLSTYLNTLNDFLLDSNKRLSFSTIDNNLYYSRVDQSNDGDSASKELNRLSSGEKQIVIMLTYLAFLAEPGSIFIVDEPELSLHLRWQRMLIDALRALCPRDCQIVLATHAPEIAGRARESCIRLKHAKVE